MPNVDSEFNFPVIPEEVLSPQMIEFLKELRGLLIRKFTGNVQVVPGKLLTNGDIDCRGNCSIAGDLRILGDLTVGGDLVVHGEIHN